MPYSHLLPSPLPFGYFELIMMYSCVESQAVLNAAHISPKRIFLVELELFMCLAQCPWGQDQLRWLDDDKSFKTITKCPFSHVFVMWFVHWKFLCWVIFMTFNNFNLEYLAFLKFYLVFPYVTMTLKHNLFQ